MTVLLYNSVGVIGGDKRMLYCAKAFLNDGLKVTLGGFDKIKSEGELEITSPLEAALCSEFIVLPLPCVKGGKLNAPLNRSDVYIDDGLVTAMSGKKIFCGMKYGLFELAPKLNTCLVYDYSTREEFAVRNAVSTAEGALEIAMREFEGTISGARVLVCGFGRIGKVLCSVLSSLNADVTVSARKRSDLEWISINGAKAVSTFRLSEENPFDIIFNTIPALVLDGNSLIKVRDDALIIDLASKPGGVDFDLAKELGKKVIWALSLPGRVAPVTAGIIIKDTITNMIAEEV